MKETERKMKETGNGPGRLERGVGKLKEREWPCKTKPPPSTSTSRTASRAEIHHLLPRLTDDDVLTFFHTFERAMNLNRVEKEDWPRFLPAQLNSKANKVLSGLSLEENENYDICKQAVLNYFQLGPSTYLKAFRTLKRANGENYKMYRNRLKEFLKYYIEAKGIDDLDAMADAMLAEQFLEMLPLEIRQFVISKQPQDSEQCCEFADLFSEVTRNTNKPASPRNAAADEIGNNSHLKSNGANRSNGYSKFNASGKRPAACWNCNGPDHKYAQCPRRVAPNNHPIPGQRNSGYGPYVPYNAVYTTALDRHQNNETGEQNPYVFPVCVNGIFGYALRDTGNNSLTLVDPRIVRAEDFTGETVNCRGAFDPRTMRVKYR